MSKVKMNEPAEILFDFTSGITEGVARVDMGFFQNLMSNWAATLETASDRQIIGMFQDRLRTANDVEYAIVLAKEWIHERKLIEAAKSGNYEEFLVTQD